jgi:hypothetical protein
MPVFNNREDDEDTTFDEVTAMADRLKLSGKGRMTYIDDHMQQLGYEPVQSRDSYVRKQQEQEDQGESGNRWGFGGGSRAGSRGRSGGSRRDEDDSF